MDANLHIKRQRREIMIQIEKLVIIKKRIGCNSYIADKNRPRICLLLVCLRSSCISRICKKYSVLKFKK